MSLGVEGMHQGKLSQEARERRKAKNARNQSRRGQATRPRGSSKKPHPAGRRR